MLIDLSYCILPPPSLPPSPLSLSLPLTFCPVSSSLELHTPLELGLAALVERRPEAKGERERERVREREREVQNDYSACT